MSRHRIALLVGSLRRESINRKLAEVVKSMAPDTHEFVLSRIDDLPLYNQDDDNNQPATAQRLKQEIASSSGVVFVTPEYNRSVPGVLKNAIDHASRPYGKNSWKGKPAGILGASPGSLGTSCSQFHLRQVLVSVEMPTLPTPEYYLTVGEDTFSGEHGLADKPRAKLKKWMDAYLAWVGKFAE